MARLTLHRLPTPKRAGEAAALLVRLNQERRRVVVWVGDAEKARVLDDYLWTFDPHSFLPHAIAGSSDDLGDEPIVVVVEPENPSSADVLVVADGLPPLDWAAGFAEVHDLLPPGAAGEERRSCWDGWRGEVEEAGA